MLTGRLLHSQSFINCLDECVHLYVNSHLWSKCALQYIFLYRRLRGTFFSNSLWKQMARMCLRIMLNLREFNSIPSSLFSHTITHCMHVCVCVCPCRSVTQVCMCVAWYWRKTTLCISYSPPSVAEMEKTTKQRYRKEQESAISPMSPLNLHKFSSIDLAMFPITSQEHFS